MPARSITSNLAQLSSDTTSPEYGLGRARASTVVPRDPESNATCQTDFQWSYDAAQHTPCFVAAAVVGGCGTSDYDVPALNNGSHYNSPGVSGQPLNLCTCSWAAYNLYSACTACQGLDASVLTWQAYSDNCGSLLSNATYYPPNVVPLDNTSIPFYATVDPSKWQNAIFNASQAMNVSEQGHADVYGAPLTSASSTSSPKSKSKAGAIGGGVAGGVVVLLIGAIIAWWLLRKRGVRKNGKPQELDSTVYGDHGHTRTYSDVSKASNVGDSSVGNSNSGYVGSVSMQQLQVPGFSSNPFGSSSNMGSVSSMGIYTTPPHPSTIQGPPSTYNGRASTIISRYSSPSPSMQYMNRSQSPDSSLGGGHEMVVQPFLLPPMSPPLPASKTRTSVNEIPLTSGNSQESLDNPPPPRRMNPPTYDDAVAISDSQDVAAQRRETHGTGHRPLLPEKQPSQASAATSQDSTVRFSPASLGHLSSANLAAIDAYVNRRHSGTEGVDTIPMLHTVASAPGQATAQASLPKRLTMNTTIDDGNGSVLGEHREGHGDGDSFGIA
jgi:hypothetical protein